MATKTTKSAVKKSVTKAVKITKEVKTHGAQEAPVYSVSGEAKGTVTLPVSVFGQEVNQQLIAQAVRVYRANQREGGASTKTRGLVSGSTRKIYKQKGTGRARHGGIRAPIFVGGGIVFGPQARDFSLQFPKSMSKKATLSAFALAVKENKIVVIDGAKEAKPKTKIVAKGLIEMKTNARVLVITDDMKSAYVKAMRNIEGVLIVPSHVVTTYDIVIHKTICITKEGLTELEKRFGAK